MDECKAYICVTEYIVMRCDKEAGALKAPHTSAEICCLCLKLFHVTVVKFILSESENT